MKIEFESLLNLPELEITSVEIKERKLHIHCRSILSDALCPSCLEKSNTVKKYYHRTIRDLPIAGRFVYLHLEERQFYCDDCEHYFSERFSFVAPNRQTTQRYETYLFERCEKSVLSQVCVLENICWPTLQGIYERQGKAHLSKSDKVVWLGIDEIALRRGHGHFATVLVDLKRACVIDLLPKRTQDFLTSYFRRKGVAFCEGIKVFSCDMWDGFVNVAKALMPNADIVIDRFHITKQLNDALDQYRKALRRAHQQSEAFKGIKWLLLKDPLEFTKEQRKNLKTAFQMAPQLEQFYIIKQDFRKWFDLFDKPNDAKVWIKHWITQAQALDNPYLNRFIKTFRRWEKYILNFFKYRISNGLVEGFNNLIKSIKRYAFGFNNFDHFRIGIKDLRFAIIFGILQGG